MVPASMDIICVLFLTFRRRFCEPTYLQFLICFCVLMCSKTFVYYHNLCIIFKYNLVRLFVCLFVFILSVRDSALNEQIF